MSVAVRPGTPEDGVGLDVSGGRRGTVARVGDLYRAGQLLVAIGDDVAQVAGQVLGAAADPALLVGMLRAPGSVMRAEQALLAAATGPAGALPVAARARVLGEALVGIARGYAIADAMAAAGFHAVGLLAGRVAGRVLAPVLGPAALVAGTLLVIADRPGRRPTSTGPVAPGAPRRPRALGRDTLRLLALAGPVLERAMAAAPGVAAGAMDVLPGSGPGLGALAGLAGPPQDVAELAALGTLPGAVSPVLHESGRARIVASPVSPATPPAGVADVLRLVGGADGRSVRVEQVQSVGRRAWIVGVPGTRDWSTWPTQEPLDLTGNVHALAGRRTAAVDGVLDAMREAGVRPGDPVLLAGHSQGGMVAAQAAADPRLRQRFTVTHVVTAGAPVALARVPDDVTVLSFEHAEDPVPRLDGAANPDRPTWVTVRGGGTGRPHELADYVRTAQVVDGSDDASLVAVRQSLAPFLDRPGAAASAVDFTMTREQSRGQESTSVNSIE